MVDTFYATPTNTAYSPLSTHISSAFSPSSRIVLEEIVTPILPTRTSFGTTTFSNIPFINASSNLPYIGAPIVPRVVTNFGVTSIYNPRSLYYYDSGIGENPLARHETNTDLRYKFLDKWLLEDNQDILRMLKVDGNHVKVLSKEEAEKNDISKDSEKDVDKKADFIGYEILTLHKNGKILDALCMKNNLKYYDLPYNEHFVRKAQAKYVKSKLEEMRK